MNKITLSLLLLIGFNSHAAQQNSRQLEEEKNQELEADLREQLKAKKKELEALQAQLQAVQGKKNGESNRWRNWSGNRGH